MCLRPILLNPLEGEIWSIFVSSNSFYNRLQSLQHCIPHCVMLDRALTVPAFSYRLMHEECLTICISSPDGTL